MQLKRTPFGYLFSSKTTQKTGKRTNCLISYPLHVLGSFVEKKQPNETRFYPLSHTKKRRAEENRLKDEVERPRNMDSVIKKRIKRHERSK